VDSKVIIAPLNWGLGHATRCIPIIRSFIEKDWNVVLASDGDALQLLKEEFPDLPAYEIPGYNISYPYSWIIGNMLSNLRSFSKGTFNEHQEIQKIVEKEAPDLIISDNRYGVRSNSCKSIFVGHQIRLKAGNFLSSVIGSKINQNLISRFDELWIPDYENGQSLAGLLTKPLRSIPVQYLGPLSRFEKRKEAVKYDLCAIISGPQPQRSRFQNILIDQLSKLDENTVIVLGNLDEDKDYMLNETTRVISYLTSEKLNDLINKSKVIISRSGYSTIMDLDKLGKSAILVPTPGQSEQLYLAKHLSGKSRYVMQSQKKINIPLALEKLLKRRRAFKRAIEFDIEEYLV